MRNTVRYCFIAWMIITGIHCTGASLGAQDPKEAPNSEKHNFEDTWGVKILGIRLTAGGYMLDFRYRVIDAEKAAPLFSRKKNPYLIDQATGAKFIVPESPKVGAMRQTRPPVADRNYFIIFGNPAKYVKKGKSVTVVIGDFKATDLIVE